MSEKIIVAMNLEEAAIALTNMAKLTADGSKNWDNYKEICLQILKQIAESKT